MITFLHKDLIISIEGTVNELINAVKEYLLSDPPTHEILKERGINPDQWDITPEELHEYFPNYLIGLLWNPNEHSLQEFLALTKPEPHHTIEFGSDVAEYYTRHKVMLSNGKYASIQDSAFEEIPKGKLCVKYTNVDNLPLNKALTVAEVEQLMLNSISHLTSKEDSMFVKLKGKSIHVDHIVMVDAAEKGSVITLSTGKEVVVDEGLSAVRNRIALALGDAVEE